MNKELSKARIHRSKLRSNFLQNRSSFKKYPEQQNQIAGILIRKTLLIIKTFWKTVTPFLSDKVLSTERITLLENDIIINNDSETANITNTLSSNIVINLSFPGYHGYEDVSASIYDPFLNAIVKYRNHASIKAIKKVSNSSHLFSFDIVDREKILKGISSLDHTKACQESDIIYKNADI